MIVLDTNVCSELLRPQPSSIVLNWLGNLLDIPATTVITRAELLSGAELLPEGRRKQKLQDGIQWIFSTMAEVLPLTTSAADEYAKIVARRQRLGRPISSFDALIAAISMVNGAAIATRNVKDFQYIDIKIINPWAI